MAVDLYARREGVKHVGFYKPEAERRHIVTHEMMSRPMLGFMYHAQYRLSVARSARDTCQSVSLANLIITLTKCDRE